ncbi:hypothetical protein, partial [Iningainema tapete]|uniref:hypothetical protein n=1 Tax=Iningainema tapete TaxID=2806730 RepID=UPI001EE19AFF
QQLKLLLSTVNHTDNVETPRWGVFFISTPQNWRVLFDLNRQDAKDAKKLNLRCTQINTDHLSQLLKKLRTQASNTD